MENLAPPLYVLLSVRHGLSAGRSLRTLLREALACGSSSDFHARLRKWWVSIEAGAGLEAGYWQDQSIYRQALVKLLEQGLLGASIGEGLKDLETEIRRAMEEELGEFVATLPIKSLFPLVLFIFPGLMILIFGPLLMQLMESFQ